MFPTPHFRLIMNSRLTLAFLLCAGFSGFTPLAAQTAKPPADETVPRLREKLKSELTFSRRFAVEELGKLGTSAAAATPELISVLAACPDPMTRIRAAWALGEIREPLDKVAPALIAALSDPEPGVRTNAGTALVRCGEPVLPEIDLALKSGNDLIRLGAAEVRLHLSKDAAEALVPVLSSLMTHQDARIRQRAVAGIAIIGRPARAVMPNLVICLKDEDVEVRNAALRTLSLMDADDVTVDAIAGVLKSDASKYVRVNAAEVLGIVGLDRAGALDTLIGAFADSDKRTRARVVESTAKFGAAAIPKVIAAARTESLHNAVRLAALDTLTQMGPVAAPAVGELLEYLANDGSWQVRHCAAAALGASGVAEPRVLSGVKKALEDDESPEVKLVAETALRALNRPEKAKPKEQG